MGIKQFFSNHTETSEKHPAKELQTRYYKANKLKTIRTLEEILHRDSRIAVLSISEEHGEITAEYVKGKKAFMVVSIITVFPYRTAVDFTITTRTFLLPFDWGFSRKEVLSFYKQLDRALEFAGTGLSEKSEA